MINKYTVALREQVLLAAAGFDPGPIDGSDGTRTSAALTAFYRERNCPLESTVTTPGLKALCSGLLDIGYSESPPGSNQTKYGVWFGHDGIPWCNLFVSYHLLVAGIELCKDFHALGVRPGRGSAYVPSTLLWLQKHGMARAPAQAIPGDIVMFDWHGDGHADHIGFCATRPNVHGGFWSLEGNTSAASDSNGGQVQLRQRQLRHVVSVGRCW